MSYKYQHNAKVLIGQEAYTQMARIMQLYAMADRAAGRSKHDFGVIFTGIERAEEHFAMLGHMPREDPREVLVRAPEYRKLNRRMN